MRSEDIPEIREMRTEDAETVAGLTSELGYERTSADIRQWIAELGSGPRRQAAFVACLDGTVVGWVEISLEARLQSDEFAFVGGLVVGDGHRGCGIGRHLCERAEAWAWEHGVSKVRVTSRSTRADAHRFYVRDGYEVVKTSLVFEKKRP